MLGNISQPTPRHLEQVFAPTSQHIVCAKTSQPKAPLVYASPKDQHGNHAILPSWLGAKHPSPLDAKFTSHAVERPRSEAKNNPMHQTFCVGFQNKLDQDGKKIAGIKCALPAEASSQVQVFFMVIAQKKATLLANRDRGVITAIQCALGVAACDKILANPLAHVSSLESKVISGGCRTSPHMLTMGEIMSVMRLIKAEQPETYKDVDLSKGSFVNDVLNAGQSTNDQMTGAAVLLNVQVLSHMQEICLSLKKNGITQARDGADNPIWADILTEMGAWREKALSNLPFGATAVGDGVLAEGLLEQGKLYNHLTDTFREAGVITAGEQMSPGKNFGRSTVDTSLFRELRDNILLPMTNVLERYIERNDVGVTTRERELLSTLCKFCHVDMNIIGQMCDTGANFNLNSLDPLADFIPTLVMERLSQALVLAGSEDEIADASRHVSSTAPQPMEIEVQREQAQARHSALITAAEAASTKYKDEFILGSTEHQPAVPISAKHHFTSLQRKFEITQQEIAKAYQDAKPHIDNCLNPSFTGDKAEAMHFIKKWLGKISEHVGSARTVANDIEKYALAGYMKPTEYGPASSIMPQKVNPVGCEHTRISAAICQSLISLVTDSGEHLTSDALAHVLERIHVFEGEASEALQQELTNAEVCSGNLERAAERGILATTLREMRNPAYGDAKFGYDTAKKFATLCNNHGFEEGSKIFVEKYCTRPGQNSPVYTKEAFIEELKQSVRQAGIPLSTVDGVREELAQNKPLV